MTAVDSRARIAPVRTSPEPPAILQGQLRALQTGRRALRFFGVVLLPILAGYALFDRGFAYIHVPGTPIFPGELVMLVGFAAFFLATGYFHRAIQRSTAAKVLLVFAAWGLVRTLPFVGSYGIDAIRDAALWYYALIAIAVCALLLACPDVLPKWTRLYGRFVPWLLIWSPLALFLDKSTHGGPAIPGTSIGIFDHKGANISVQVTIALAFLWLVPAVNHRFRVHLTALATVVLLIGATQGRSGFVAAAAGLAIVALFSHGRGRLAFAMAVTVLMIVVAGWGLNVEIQGEQGRTVSVQQLAQNITSVVGGNNTNSPGYLQANVQFRDRLWAATLRKVRDDRKVATGLGFGFNIAKSVGFEGGDDVQLRSPHNSHLDVYARMGLIGFALWVALWGVWFTAVAQARSKFRALGRRVETGLAEVAIVGAVAILVNAYFDPTLESPPVAVWLWTIVGVGLALAAIARRAKAAPPRPPGKELVIAR